MSVPPQDLVERALNVATLPCVAWVTERTEANLRWANNGLITNGEMRSRSLTVTAIAAVEGGTAAGTVSQQIAGADEVRAVVAAAESLALPVRSPLATVQGLSLEACLSPRGTLARVRAPWRSPLDCLP